MGSTRWKQTKRSCFLTKRSRNAPSPLPAPPRSPSLFPHMPWCTTQLLSRPGPAKGVETIILPTPSFRGPVCFLKIYHLFFLILLENCTLGCWGKKYKQKIKGSSKEELQYRGMWERHTMSQHHKNNSSLASSHRNQSTSQWQTLSRIYNREAETEQNLIQNPARW